ncbi:MAG: hypothetical protein NUV65_02895 [Candidatus Roizmanbacteria bacterium]|nr:hypothetical protein [Candidatus Roizmanbacteria bacterium]
MQIPKVILWIGIGVIILICGLLLQRNRSFLEKTVLVTFFNYVNPQKQLSEEKSLSELANKEKIRTLIKENAQLKVQLGFIPEKANLMPVRVLWSNGTHYTITFDLPKKNTYSIVGVPVIYKDILVGTILRASGEVAVFQQVSDASFEHKGVTDRGVKGTIKGGFGQEVVFEAPVDTIITKGDRLFAIDEKKGWRFLVGTVQAVDATKNLPTQSARITYFASTVPSHLLYVAL